VEMPAAGVASFIAKVFASFVVSRIATGLLSRDKDPRSRLEDLTRGIRANTRSTSVLLPIIYGQMKIGGNDVFMESQGSSNNILWIVQNLAEGECEGIAQEGGVDQLFLGDKLWNTFGGNVSYWFHSGTASQTVNSSLHSAISKWTDCKHYTTYIVWKLTYSQDYFQNLPERLALLKGRKLYDFRDESTAWSQNPVLALYDFITNTRYGEGVDSSKIDIPSWISAANYCDTAGWKINMIINQQDMYADKIRENILSSFRGHLVWYDGKYYLRYSDLNYESSVMTLQDNHIAQDDDGRAQVRISEPSRFHYPDGMKVTFINADKNYTEDTVIIGDSLGVLEQIHLEAITDRETASNIGTYLLERKQLDRMIRGTFRDDALKLEPHDIVTFNSTALSISDQLMRVKEERIRPDGLIDLVLMYESDTLYNDDYDYTAEDTFECDLPSPEDEPPNVTNVSFSEETYHYRLRTFTRLKITFDPPSNYAWFDRVAVWLSLDAGSTWKYLYDVNTDFNIDNVEEGQHYQIKLQTVSIWGTKTRFANSYLLDKTILGKTSNPASVTDLSAIVNANSISLYSYKVLDPDVELYEFRLGTSWSGAIFLGAYRSPNLSLYGVKPGSHTFYINTLANNNQYGDTPRSTSVSLPEPPIGWTIQNTETCDYDGVGSHDNTEHTTYNSEDYLRCSHTSGVLVGTYTSPIYDRGSSAEYLVYLLADIVITGTGTDWDSVIPSPNTWESISIDTRSWTEIFELPAGPKVEVKMKYGETSPPTNEVERMEILGTVVTGRYFQVEIMITDPSEAINALVEHFELKFCQ